MNRLRLGLSLAAASAVLAVAGCASSAASPQGGAAGTPPSTPASTPATSTAPTAVASATSAPTAAAAKAAAACTWGPAESDPSSPKTGKPPTSAPHTGTATMTIVTNEGSIVIKTDRAATPCTVASFAYLGAAKFFNNSPCHRLTAGGIFVLQCGDPTGSGSGGPSYTIPDEALPVGGDGAAVNYARGTVAMANTGQPNSGGSQFFLVYKNSPLAPSYTKFGTITTGLNILDKIAAAGTADGSPDGAPKLPVKILSLTVKAS